MEGLTLEASKREILGKRTRFLRRKGITPAHLFGHGLESLALQCDTANLRRLIARAGKTRLVALGIEGDKEPRSVFIKEIQRDPRTGELLHVDLFQVSKAEKVRVDVPIILVGEAPALKAKEYTLTHSLTSLSIECLPDKLPPQIEIDLSPLAEVGQAIYVRDIPLGPEITVENDPDQMVVKVSEIKVEKVEEVVAAEEVVAEAAAEGEAVTGEAAEEGAAEKPEKPEKPGKPGKAEKPEAD
jgi:large subunit ribosomal protein L25